MTTKSSWKMMVAQSGEVVVKSGQIILYFVSKNNKISGWVGCRCWRKGVVRYDSKVYGLAARRMESPLRETGKAEKEEE